MISFAGSRQRRFRTNSACRFLFTARIVRLFAYGFIRGADVVSRADRPRWAAHWCVLSLTLFGDVLVSLVLTTGAADSAKRRATAARSTATRCSASSWRWSSPRAAGSGQLERVVSRDGIRDLESRSDSVWRDRRERSLPTSGAFRERASAHLYSLQLVPEPFHKESKSSRPHARQKE